MCRVLLMILVVLMLKPEEIWLACIGKYFPFLIWKEYGSKIDMNNCRSKIAISNNDKSFKCHGRVDLFYSQECYNLCYILCSTLSLQIIRNISSFKYCIVGILGQLAMALKKLFIIGTGYISFVQHLAFQ